MHLNTRGLTRGTMSSDSAVGDKQSASDVPDTSDDNCQRRSKEAGAGPKLEQPEEQRSKEAGAGWRNSQSVTRGAQDEGHHAAVGSSSNRSESECSSEIATLAAHG